jgi:hypothetical protein
METVLQLSAPVWGFFLGTLLFSRVGSWIQAIATAVQNGAGQFTGPVLLAIFLNSGPWLLAAVTYWGYHVLAEPHAHAWDWFFGSLVASIPIWIAISIYLHWRNKRRNAKGANAV